MHTKMRFSRKDIVAAAQEAKRQNICIVHGCGLLTFRMILLYSINVVVPVCSQHADYIRELDLATVHERICGQDDAHPLDTERLLRPEFEDEDGVPAQQEAIKVYDFRFQRYRELLDAGVIAIVEYVDDKPELEWIDPNWVIPYNPYLEEAVTGLKVTASEFPAWTLEDWQCYGEELEADAPFSDEDDPETNDDENDKEEEDVV